MTSDSGGITSELEELRTRIDECVGIVLDAKRQSAIELKRLTRNVKHAAGVLEECRSALARLERGTTDG